MTHMSRPKSALVLVDYQQRLMPMIHDHERVQSDAVFLGEVARALGIKVLGTEQNPAGLGPNAPAIRNLCEETLPKMHFDACRDGLLQALHLDEEGERRGDTHLPSQVVIAGCEAHVCLLQTALGLLKAGFITYVVASACGSRSAADKELAMQRLQQAGAIMVSREMVAFEWLDSCKGADFKTVLGLIKAAPLRTA